MRAATRHPLVPPPRSRPLRILAAALLLAVVLAGSARSPRAQGESAVRDTFAIDFIVEINRPQPVHARVRWELSGAEEVDEFRFVAPRDRFSDVKGSGKVEVGENDEVRWRPSGPYGHLEYSVRIDHHRGTKGRFDTYAGDGWVVARSRDLFPLPDYEIRSARDGTPPRSRARLLFRLPKGWKSATAHPQVAPHTFRLGGGNVVDRPTGWIALGKLDVSHQEIDNVMVRIARVSGARMAVDEIYGLLADAIPRMRRIFRAMPPEMLIVSAGDPMWRGGLSGYRSMFLHADRPLRTADKTAPVLHELFHVAQPFRGAPDADWIIEGLAEYYSLELQRRAGELTATGVAKGLESFGKYGLWNVDMTKQHDNAATNNSAPLILWALDQRIQRETAGKKRLDDVVHLLAGKHREVDTAMFRGAVQAVTGKRLEKFFERHVLRGERPKL